MTEFVIGNIVIREEPTRVTVNQAGGDWTKDAVVIRTPLEAQALARTLADTFGDNLFKVIRTRAAGGHFSA